MKEIIIEEIPKCAQCDKQAVVLQSFTDGEEPRCLNHIIHYVGSSNSIVWYKSMEDIKGLEEVKTDKICIKCACLDLLKNEFFCPMIKAYLSDEAANKPFDCKDFIPISKKAID